MIEKSTAAEDRGLPVTILSGFLGSGKTTLLNHILEASSGFRVAVLVNDYGDIGIDGDLLLRPEGGEVVDLPGGCACCAIRGDLLRSIEDLLGSGRVFDFLVMEASGLADPAAVVQTFAAPAVAERLRLDAVMTVVDAENFELWLASQPVATEQILCADLLVLNKTDLVAPDAVEAVLARLAAINPEATILPATRGRLPIELLLDVRRRPGGAGEYTDVPHHHDAELGAVSYSGDGRMDFPALQRFLESLPEGVLRAKGIVAVEGLDRELVFHRVGRRNFLDQGRPWSGPELSRAVFIGSGFDRDEVLAGIRSCRLESAPARVRG